MLSSTDVAVIVALPVDMAVTTPELLTVATLVLLLDQVTAWLGLFSPLTVADKVDVLVPLIYKDNADGETVTEVTVGTTGVGDVTVT